MVIYAYFGGLRGKKYLACVHSTAVPVEDAVVSSTRPLPLPVSVSPYLQGKTPTYSARVYVAKPDRKTARHLLVKDLGQFNEQVEAVGVLERFAERKLDWALDPRDF